MIRNSGVFLLIIFAILFVQCKRNVLQTNPTVTHLSDYESADGQVKLNIKGGKEPYRVEWSSGLSDSVAANLHAGIYFVTVTDARNRIHVDTITLNQPEWPVCIDGEGNSYKTAVFGDQIWMLENLKATVTNEGSPIPYVALALQDSLGERQEFVYTWNAAMQDITDEPVQGICPDGWHIPSDKEWSVLIDNISSFDQEIPNLEKKLELTYPGFYNGQHINPNASVSFWTSTQAGDNAWKRYFNKNLSKAFRYHEIKSNAISVRCIKD